MDVAALKTFVAVAETGSFSEAAERLFLTQPAISKRVAGLEDELRARLFDRIGRLVTLTEAGHALLPRARRILAEVEDSQRAISNLSGHVAGRLSLGTSHHIGLHRLPPVLRRFMEGYPEVSLDLRFLDSETGLREVEHGDVELALVTLPESPPPILEVMPLWPDPLVFVAGPEHPLANRPLQPSDLADHLAVLPGKGTYTRGVVEQGLAPYGVEPQVELSTNYLETIKMMVSVGLGWSVLPETMVDAEVCRLALPGPRLVRTLGLARHRGRTLSNAARALLALLEEEAQDAASE